MKKALKRLDDDDDERAEFIAREFLDILAEKILKIIHSLIKANQSNSEKLTKHDSIIYVMLTRYDTRIVGKIFKETFKRAQYIFGDKSAAIVDGEGGLDN